MEKWERENFDRLKAATAGIDLTAGEERTLKWLSGWETSTVDNVAHIIEKARGAKSAGKQKINREASKV